MRTLHGYILRQLVQTFAIALITLTALGWLSQVVAFLDIIVEKGRPASEFFMVTGLVVPLVVTILSPTAAFVACVFVLNRLGGESELAVIHGAGVSPGQLVRPFLTIGLIATTLMVGLNLYAKPWGLRAMRDHLTEIRTDVFATLVREGQFVSPELGVTVHIKDQARSNELIGIIVDDSRDPAAAITYIAERARVVETDDRSVLVLKNGTVQRRRGDAGTIDVLVFAEYALDLSPYTGKPRAGYRPEEKFTSELIDEIANAPFDDSETAGARAEFHDRLSSPLWPVAAVLIAFVGMARARSPRAGRVWTIALIAAIALAARMAGAGTVIMLANDEPVTPLLYAIPLAAIVIAAGAIIANAGRGSQTERRHDAIRPPHAKRALAREPADVMASDDSAAPETKPADGDMDEAATPAPSDGSVGQALGGAPGTDRAIGLGNQDEQGPAPNTEPSESDRTRGNQ